jgi:hypothetical protein
MPKRLKTNKKRSPRWGLKGISPENWWFGDWEWGDTDDTKNRLKRLAKKQDS